jgi:murein L,D-transpeptidase YafK
MRARAPRLVAAFGLALACGLACARPAPPPVEPGPAAVPPPAPPPPAPIPGPCLHIERLVANKSERNLRVHCKGGAVFTFPAAFGREPAGAKRASGDERTPEGEYHVAGPARPSRFHRFLPIDYPALADADLALAERRISRADHRRIVEAHRRGVMPPQDTPLGGLLGLHGEGARWRGDSKALDWTHGCIALPDAELDFVIDRVTKGTPITIVPR